MTNYHVRLTVAGSRHGEVKNDLDLEVLEAKFLAPYREGRPITINGTTISPGAIERLQVSESEETAAELIELVKLDQRNSSVITMGGPSLAWRAARRARDVTDQFVTGPPGAEQAKQGEGSVTAGDHVGLVAPGTGDVPGESDSRSVFVVAGRDAQLSSAVCSMLRALGLHIVEWEHAVAKTGLPNPYVGDVVVAGLQMARAAVVLLTPDDHVRLRHDLVRDDDPTGERTSQGQARPNVYYEAGIADALGRERTVLVEIGRVKSFSDAAGRHVVRYDGSAAARHTLAGRLELAGLAVDRTGNDWLMAGEIADTTALLASSESGPASEAPTVNRAELLAALDELLDFYATVRADAKHDDLSDRPAETMEFVFRAQALVDRVAVGSPFADEAAQVRAKQPHIRQAVLLAVLRSMQAEAKYAAPDDI